MSCKPESFVSFLFFLRPFLFVFLLLFPASSRILGRHPRPYLHPMPLPDEIPQRAVDQALLLEHAEPPEGRGRDVDGVHAAAAAGDVLHEEGGGVQLGGEDGGDGGFGGGHARVCVCFCFCVLLWLLLA